MSQRKKVVLVDTADQFKVDGHISTVRVVDFGCLQSQQCAENLRRLSVKCFHISKGFTFDNREGALIGSRRACGVYRQKLRHSRSYLVFIGGGGGGADCVFNPLVNSSSLESYILISSIIVRLILLDQLEAGEAVHLSMLNLLSQHFPLIRIFSHLLSYLTIFLQV